LQNTKEQAIDTAANGQLPLHLYLKSKITIKVESQLHANDDDEIIARVRDLSAKINIL